MKTAHSSVPSFSRGAPGPEVAMFYDREGYLVLEDALTADEVARLNAEAVEICRGRRGDVLPSTFYGDDMAAQEGRARGQTELEALSDNEVLARMLCIHFPHKISDVIHQALAHPAIVETLTAVIGPNVKCMQSMLFIKAAGKPGQAWHQDEDYIPTRDRSLIGAWIALDDANVDNGCLWIIPGSHRPGVLWPQYPHGDKRFDCSHESYDFPYGDDDAVPVEVKAGSIVFFNGYTLHRSLPNLKASGFRRSLVNHYMSAESFLPWQPVEGTPIAKTDNRDIVMIAGKDPYAWKGLEDRFHCHVRPAGQGGCGDGRANLKEYRQRPLEERIRK